MGVVFNYFSNLLGLGDRSSFDNDRNNSIDLLRAVAIILVVSIHAAQNFDPIFSISTQIPKSYGQNGVQLFFMISGYTMLLTYGNRFDLISIVSFYIRRLFRIAPLFWLAAVVYFFQYGFGPRAWAPNGIDWGDIALAISFLGYVRPNALNSVVPGGWSVANEMLFYFVFPVFYFLFSRNFNKAPYLIMLVIEVLGYILRKSFLQDYFSLNKTGNDLEVINFYFYFWMPAQIICFGFGFILFELIEKKAFNCFGLILISLASWNAFGLILFFLFLFSYFILSLAISNRFLSLIGQASYSIYLIHFGVISAISWLMRLGDIKFPFELAFVSVVFISFFIAECFTKPLIEDKFIAIGKNLSKRLKNFSLQSV